MIKRKIYTTLLALTLFLPGCAGVRNSYESLLDTDSDKPLIVLEVGEKREILAVGNGFPGWWGYYPTAASLSPEVASVTCKQGRSFIPFREPGVVFGGNRCYLQAHKKGSSWLLLGNSHTLYTGLQKIGGTTMPEGHDLPEDKWAEVVVEVEVLQASDR